MKMMVVQILPNVRKLVDRHRGTNEKSDIHLLFSSFPPSLDALYSMTLSHPKLHTPSSLTFHNECYIHVAEHTKITIERSSSSIYTLFIHSFIYCKERKFIMMMSHLKDAKQLFESSIEIQCLMI